VDRRDDEVGIAYEPWYDEYASVFELTAGKMMHWPLNSPHRIENLDMLSVSMTTEYYTRDIRRKLMAVTGNGVLRKYLGIDPEIVTSGPSFWSKALIQAAARRTGMLTGERRKRRAVSFKLDPDRPGQIIDL